MQRRGFVGAMAASAWSAGAAVRILYDSAGGPEAVAAREIRHYIGELTCTVPALVEDAHEADGPEAEMTMLVGRTRRARRLIEQRSVLDPRRNTLYRTATRYRSGQG